MTDLNIDFLLSQVQNHAIDGGSIDWVKWMKPTEMARIIPAERLADECKKIMLLGRDAEEGVTLPWTKTHGKVFIRKGKLCVWCGWSHHGKSQMLKQVMLHAIHRGEKVLIASMEEEIREIFVDLARCYSGVEEPSIKSINSFIEYISGNLWLYDQQGEVEMERILAVLRYSASIGVTHIVIDSLMMLAMNREDYDAQSRFVGALKSACKDTGVTAHLVAHMRKRDGKNGDQSIGTPHDIAGAHDIASKADYVFNVWRNKEPKENEPSCLLGVEKQRGAKNWIGKVALHYHPASRQYVESPNRPIQFWRSDDQRRTAQEEPREKTGLSGIHGHAERTTDREPGCEDEASENNDEFVF